MSEIGIELVASGLLFPEGPIALSDGAVLLVEMRRRTLTRIDSRGAITVVAELGGGPNGAALGPDGAVYICNNGNSHAWVEKNGKTVPGRRPANYEGGSIQRVDLHTGEVRTVFSQHNGASLVAPNDLVFDRSGRFWFTDHGGYEEDKLYYGALYYGTIDGTSLTCARRGLITPNGVGLSPDETTLYFAETITGRLWACEIKGSGQLARQATGPGRVLTTLGNYHQFDSLAVEADGRVCVGTLLNGGVTIVCVDGTTEHVAFPDPLVTNLAFGGADMRDAWVTGSSTGTLYRCRWPRAGHRLNFSEPVQ